MPTTKTITKRARLGMDDYYLSEDTAGTESLRAAEEKALGWCSLSIGSIVTFETVELSEPAAGRSWERVIEQITLILCHTETQGWYWRKATEREQLEVMTDEQLASYLTILRMSRKCLQSTETREKGERHINLIMEVAKERGLA